MNAPRYAGRLGTMCGAVRSALQVLEDPSPVMVDRARAILRSALDEEQRQHQADLAALDARFPEVPRG